MDRKTLTVTLIRRNLTQSLKRTLTDSIGEHYSEADAERIATVAAGGFVDELAGNLDFDALISGGDLRNSRGDVNTDGILQAMKDLAEARKGEPKVYNTVRFLVQHVERTFKNL